jgi:putative membrane protein
MTGSHPPPKPLDETTELARERNRIAADRTLLAWVRLSLTLIGIGFGIDQTVTLLYSKIVDVINPYRLSHLLGLLLVGLGVYALILAMVDYRGELHRLQQPEYRFTPRYRLGETVAIALMAIAMLTFATILWRLWRS